jgi:hypothetical protein
MNRKESYRANCSLRPGALTVGLVDRAIDFERLAQGILIESPLLFLDHQDILADQMGQQFLATLLRARLRVGERLSAGCLTLELARGNE